MATAPISPAPAAPKNHTLLYAMLILVGLFFLSFVFIVFAIQHVLTSTTDTSFISSGNEISLVEIQGPIYESDDLVRLIKRFRKSSKKALILRIDSPGGVVAPSQEIYAEILRARQDKKIIVASMASLAASGAYYIASACDKIVANPGTLTGSIGVIFEIPEASGLLKKVGVDYQVIKSGKFKDTGSISRPMNPQEKEYIQGTINEVFNQFLDAVIDGRRKVFQQKLAKRLGKKPEDVTDQDIRTYLLPYADGRVVTGQTAYELGLVDQMGDYEDAVQLTADLAGIKGEPTVRLDKPSRIEDFLKSMTPLSSLTSRVENGCLMEYRAF
jgi:protease IV